MLPYKMLAKEVDGIVYPGHTNCPYGNCPSVVQRADGMTIVVGKKLTESEIHELEATDLLKVHDDEFAVLVNPELLRVGVGSLS